MHENFKKAKILYDHKLYDIYLDIFFLKEYDYDLTLGNMKDSTYNFKIGVLFYIEDINLINDLATNFKNKNISIIYNNMEIKCYSCNRINLKLKQINLHFDFYYVSNNLRAKKLKKIMI